MSRTDDGNDGSDRTGSRDGNDGGDGTGRSDGSDTRTPGLSRRVWRAGPAAWLLAAAVAVAFTGALMDDLAHTPTWWRATLQGLGLLGSGTFTFRMLVWRITATRDGLRVRALCRVALLPWDGLRAAVPAGSGTLALVGTCPGKRVVVDYAGFLRPHRLAAEIGAMIDDPALRPAS